MKATNKQSLFQTFDSIEELQNYVSKFNGSEAVVANIVMMMTINTMNKIHAEEIKDLEEKILDWKWATIINAEEPRTAQ